MMVNLWLDETFAHRTSYTSHIREEKFFGPVLRDVEDSVVNKTKEHFHIINKLGVEKKFTPTERDNGTQKQSRP